MVNVAGVVDLRKAVCGPASNAWLFEWQGNDAEDADDALVDEHVGATRLFSVECRTERTAAARPAAWHRVRVRARVRARARGEG